MTTARAIACSNIALCKYWGKREGVARDLNLPAVGSLSLTLDALRTETTLAPAATDRFVLDDRPETGAAAVKVFAHLDRVWQAAHPNAPRPPYSVVSHNRFPTAAGLASSASGFAALTVAAASAFGLAAGKDVLSRLARQGSGSAARSIFGGFVRLPRGHEADGSDCVAHPIAGPEHWDVRLLVVKTTSAEKALGSTEGMERSRRTSPYYTAWIDGTERDLDDAQAAIAARDLATLGRITEHSCFKMHACMLATDPAILYWNAATVDAIHAVHAARAEGLAGYVTIDAGPHVKVLCAAADAPTLRARLVALPGTIEVLVAAPGPDATVEVLA